MSTRDLRILSNLRSRGIRTGDATPEQVREAALRSMTKSEIVFGAAGAAIAVGGQMIGVVVSPEIKAERENACASCNHLAKSPSGRSCLKCGCSGQSFEAKLESPLFGCPDSPPRFMPVRLSVYGKPS